MTASNQTRTARYHRVNGRFGTLEMTCTTTGRRGSVKVETFGYYVEPLPSDFGRAFKLTKYRAQQVAGEASEYTVLIDLSEGRSQCECLGWLRWGKCKHVAAMAAMVMAEKV